MQLGSATCNRLKLTKQQEAVVNCLQGPVFVAAGAGSGKTLTVVQRFVNALARGVATVDQILTITYTEKAAGVMARRIRNQLVKNGMMEQRRLIERAQISTIHSFCAGLIKKYAFQLGLDPEFAVCDQVQADVLKEESFNICLERLMAHHGERAAELLSTCDNGRNPLFKHIADFYDKQRCQGMERPDFNIPQVADPGPLVEELKLKIAEARRTAAVSTSKAKSCFKKIDALAEATVETNWDKMRDLLSANVIGKTTNVKDEILRASIEAVKEAREKLLAVLNDKRAVPVLKLLRQLLLDFGDEYTARKRQHGLLDFEDLQLQALKLLQDHEDVRRQVAQSYKLVMVDEFQDTNQLQCQLIAQLDRGNVLTVGDQNQSIYLFRYADVDLFRQRLEEARRAGYFKPLQDNFRSQPQILDFVDFVFNRDGMLAPQGYLELNPKVDDDKRDEPFRTEIIIVDESRGENEKKLESKLLRQAEATLIARRLQQLFKEGKYSEGDVAILLRSKTYAHQYRHALDLAGINNYLSIGRDFYQKLELEDTLSLLKLLVNPLDDLSLFAVLRSPLVGVGDDVLLMLRELAGAESNMGQPVWPIMQSQKKLEALPAAERELIVRFVNDFKELRHRSRRQPLEVTVRDIVNYRDYAAKIACSPGGKRAYANLIKLQEMAADFEDAWGRDLPALVEFLKRQHQTEAPENEAPTEEEESGSVRILTIHSAKGLEFPVVVWADMGYQPPEKNPLLTYGEDGAVGLYYKFLGEKNATSFFAYSRLAEERKKKSLEEEKRIGYVAMTRAKSHLILCGTADLDKPAAGTDCRKPIEWIRSFFKLTRAEGGKLVGNMAKQFLSSDAPVVLKDAGVPVGVSICVNPEEILSKAELKTKEKKFSQLKLPAAPDLSSPPPAKYVPALINASQLDSFCGCAYRHYLRNVIFLDDASGYDDGNGEDDVNYWNDASGQRVTKAGASDEEARGEMELLPAGLPRSKIGDLVHALLKDFCFPVPTPLALEESQVRQKAAVVLGPGAGVSLEDVREVTRLVGNLAKSKIFSDLNQPGVFDWIAQEYPFSLLVDCTVLRGKIDLLAASESKSLVIDFKTGVMQADEDAAEAATSYHYQMAAYALAAGRLHKGPVEVALIFLDVPGMEYRCVYQQDELKQLEAELRSVIIDMESGIFRPLTKPNPRLCIQCPGGPLKLLVCPTGAQLSK